MSRTSLSRAEALTMRAARAAEDPCEMTRAANDSRRSRIAAEILAVNPDLTESQVERAVTLRIRAQMARLAGLSAEARRTPAAEPGAA